MRPLTAREIIGVWELCERQAPVNRAVSILESAYPELTREEIASLSIGQRDLRLLLLRERMLGSKMESIAECPACHERLEFTVDTADIRTCHLSDEEHEYLFESDSHGIRFRLIDSSDLMSIARCESIAEARARLVERCVIEAEMEGELVGAEELPEDIIEALAEKVAELDPQAEVLLNLDCPACNHQWQVLFDITSFFWDELHATAVRLFHEVDVIASAYGWREEEILAMSATKRKIYLEMHS